MQARTPDALAACPEDRVEIQGPLGARWLTPLATFCELLPALRDVDPSARLRVIPAGQEVILEVVLVDGRSVLRRVRSPGALSLTAEALLVLPPAPPVAPPTPAGPTSDEPATPPPLAEPRMNAPPPPSPSVPGPAHEIEIGGAVNGRLARSPTYLSLGPSVHAALRLRGWRLGLSARWDTVLRGPAGRFPNFEMDAVGAGFFVARRVGHVGPSRSMSAGRPCCWPRCRACRAAASSRS